MAKKKTKIDIGLIMIAAAALLGLVAICMIFVPSYKGMGNVFGSEVTFTGLQSAFGYSETSGSAVSVTTKILNVNVLATLGFLLPVVGVVLGAIFRKSDIMAFVSAGVFVASALMVFLSITTFPASVAGSEYGSLYTWSLGIGAILSGIFSVLAGCAMVFKVLLKKLLK